MEKPRLRLIGYLFASACVVLGSQALQAAEFYVAPNAGGSGNGSYGSPWTLQTALNHPSAVHPGDTIWLRGGTYRGAFSSWLNGTAAQPIIVRQYTGERATIDGGNSNGASILSVAGSYTWYWGFEIMSSDPTRYSSVPGSGPPGSVLPRGEAITTNQSSDHPGLKFINLAIHDARQGISLWKQSIDAEVYGNLIYYNGWEAPDRGHGHGIYTQNQNGTKRITDNILFSGFSYNIHVYGSAAAFLNNFDVQGNTLLNAGNLSDGNGRNFLLGGDSIAQNETIKNNYLYRSGAGPQTDLFLGYHAGCANMTVTNNYVASNTEFGGCSPVSMTGNTFYGTFYGVNPSTYPGNTYTTTRPTGQKIFLRPNAYEAGRANVTVYNWSRASTASVDLSGVLSPGQGFEIRHAQDFFGAAIVQGTYSGGSVTIPMTNLPVAAPVGWTAPPPTAPDFAVFVVLPASPGGSPTVTATRSPTSAASTPTRTPTAVASTPTKTRTPTFPAATATRTAVPSTPTRTAVPSTPTRTATPGGAGTILRIEAESPVITAPLLAVNDGSAFGGKYVVSVVVDQGTSAWTFTAPTAGIYYVWARVKAVDGNQDSFYVKMDTGAEDIYDVAEGIWSPSWQWTRLNGRNGTGVPKTLNPRSFSLSAGSHTLRFRGREPQAKLDRVIVTNNSAFVPTEVP